MELFLLVTLMATICSFVSVTGISRKQTYIRATVFCDIIVNVLAY